MTLEVLKADMIKAMKNKDKERKDTLSSLVQAVQKFGIDNKCKDNITEEQVAAVILKEKKTVQEMIDTCPVDRVETLEMLDTKMSIIEEYAPKLMTEDIEIAEFIAQLGLPLVSANRGKIMSALKGKADMRIANSVVSQLLS